MLTKILLSQPLVAQGLGLWGHQESSVGLDISFSTRAITREAWQGVGVEVVLQVALRTLASSRTGDKHDRWPKLTVAERLVWEQCNVPLEGSQKSLSVGQ